MARIRPQAALHLAGLRPRAEKGAQPVHGSIWPADNHLSLPGRASRASLSSFYCITGRSGFGIIARLLLLDRACRPAQGSRQATCAHLCRPPNQLMDLLSSWPTGANRLVKRRCLAAPIIATLRPATPRAAEQSSCQQAGLWRNLQRDWPTKCGCRCHGPERRVCLHAKQYARTRSSCSTPTRLG